jgi:AcrR family transcriptional regulator
MGKKGENTRSKILDISENIILQKGFSGTSIDEIIRSAQITKGGFFYHFDGKNELAKSLIDRYLVQDEIFFNSLFERADDLSEDPLQQMLIFLKLLAEAMEDLPAGHPGCLVASFVYESHQFDEHIMALLAEGVASWRKLFSERLEKITAHYRMSLETPIAELADALSAIIEGAIIISLTMKEPSILAKQILQYRNYLRLQFSQPRINH